MVSNFENPSVSVALVDLFKDHYISPGLLSNVKSNNRLINILGGIYAKENGQGMMFDAGQDPSPSDEPPRGPKLVSSHQKEGASEHKPSLHIVK